ncbi:hypothetical protein VTI28DRAFT_49 [Corynascus sepedonium]
MSQDVNRQNEIHRRRPRPRYRRAALPTADTNTNADGSVSSRAIKKWQAKGGCKTDWAGRCKTQCMGEAMQKGYKCGRNAIDSDISSSHCIPGWNVCECTCFT